MHNYREAVPTDRIELVNHPLFTFNREPAWSMDGDEGEVPEIQIRDTCYQRFELTYPKRRNSTTLIAWPRKRSSARRKSPLATAPVENPIRRIKTPRIS